MKSRCMRWVSGLVFGISFLWPLSISHSEEITSVITDISPKACLNVVDESDPNSTPYRECRGVSGYNLLIRNAEGRQSIDIVTPNKKIFPLRYWDFVTHHFSHLDNKVEWRLKKTKKGNLPVALIARVESHEDQDDPALVTHSYMAIAKITPKEICVTDKRLLGFTTTADVLKAADNAWEKRCLQ